MEPTHFFHAKLLKITRVFLEVKLGHNFYCRGFLINLGGKMGYFGPFTGNETETSSPWTYMTVRQSSALLLTPQPSAFSTAGPGTSVFLSQWKGLALAVSMVASLSSPWAEAGCLGFSLSHPILLF